jgi:SSS family solute:Na+ symporter
LLPAGLKGLAFAALTAAIVASLAGKANSISTIFSLDIYHKFFHRQATDRQVVRIGRFAVIGSMLIACLVAPALKSLDQAYQFIQEYVGFISPGVLAVFLMGFLWRRTTSSAALAGTLLTIPLSAVLKFLPRWTDGRFPDFPFLDRMSIVFGVVIALMILISLLDKRSTSQPRTLQLDPAMFRVSPAFMVGSVLITGILVALYTIFW